MAPMIIIYRTYIMYMIEDLPLHANKLELLKILMPQKKKKPLKKMSSFGLLQ